MCSQLYPQYLECGPTDGMEGGGGNLGMEPRDGRELVETLLGWPIAVCRYGPVWATRHRQIIGACADATTYTGHTLSFCPTRKMLPGCASLDLVETVSGPAQIAMRSCFS